jgi:hypothetical protein
MPAPVTPTTQTTPPTTGPPPPNVVTITNADNGTAIAVAPGTTINVVLTGRATRPWSMPATAAVSLVLRETSLSVNPKTGGLSATFVALSSGDGVISAVTRCMTGCVVPARSFNLSVQVT